MWLNVDQLGSVCGTPAVLSSGSGPSLVSLEANIIGYWILGTFLGIVLTLLSIVKNYPNKVYPNPI